MGRHSAAEDDPEDADEADGASAVVDLAPPRGRHSSTSDADETAPDDQQAPAKVRSASGTRADIRLLRRNGAVRFRCIAAVVVSFLLYTLVMVVIGRSDVYLLWIWVPTVLSGVLVGTLLDLAHRTESRAVITVGGHDEP